MLLVLDKIAVASASKATGETCRALLPSGCSRWSSTIRANGSCSRSMTRLWSSGPTARIVDATVKQAAREPLAPKIEELPPEPLRPSSREEEEDNRRCHGRGGHDG